jgi:hypothetical protein
MGTVLGTTPTAVESGGLRVRGAANVCRHGRGLVSPRQGGLSRSCLINAHPADAVRHDVNERNCHDQILIEMDHILRISFRQMHTEGSPQADKSK